MPFKIDHAGWRCTNPTMQSVNVLQLISGRLFTKETILLGCHTHISTSMLTVQCYVLRHGPHGTGVVLVWYWCGTGVVLVWYWCGTGVAHTLCRYPVSPRT
eukprot:scpid107428/ scgid24447/ 